MRSGRMVRTLARIDRDAARDGRFVAASIVFAGADGAEIARSAHRAGLRVFELNVGAPHASEATPGAIAQETDPARLGELVARASATDGMQFWVKLTGLSANLPALALSAKEFSAPADAVIMMGRFMAMVPDLDILAAARHLRACTAVAGRCPSFAASSRSVGVRGKLPPIRCSARMVRVPAVMSQEWRLPAHQPASCFPS